MTAVRPLRWAQNPHSRRWAARAGRYDYTVDVWDERLVKDDHGRARVEKCAVYWRALVRRGDGPLFFLDADTAQGCMALVDAHHAEEVAGLLTPEAAARLAGA